MKKIVSLLVICLLSVSLLIGCSIPSQKNTAMQKWEVSQGELLQNVNTDATAREERKETMDPGHPKELQTEGRTVGDAAVVSEMANLPATLCETCGDDDCDDGIYCDDADELAENLWEAEQEKKGTPCKICGQRDCDDSPYCDDYWDDEDCDDDDDHHHGRHGRHHKD